MSGTAPHPRQGVVAAWLSQMVGTVVLAAVVLAFVKAAGAPFAASGRGLHAYAFTAILAATVPALAYLRSFRTHLVADEAATRTRGGAPDPAARKALLRALAIGGALCELPMAVGALDLLCGGESRLFVGATILTLAMRLSHRPFLPRAAA
ncbi:MAG TPA: hypothetical protein VEG27_02270 [Usitatibacter sp.]|nr:hypothetical protein [Usitatibacter sp.]